MKNSDINININPQSEEKKEPIYTQVGKKISSTIANAKWSKIFKVYFVTFFFLATGLFFYFSYRAVGDDDIMKQTALKMSTSEKEENIRDYIVTPKIQHDLDILVYTINADRAFLFELHNGKKNTSGLPFRFADMTYEETNEDKKIDKVAMDFQDIPLTLYKYPHYLQKKKIIIGTVDEIEEVDRDFAKHIKDIGGVYLGMIYISNRGIPLGFLCVSYHNMNDVPSKDVIERKLREHDQSLKQLLDLETQINAENDVTNES